jgi:hypothetical protein
MAQVRLKSRGTTLLDETPAANNPNDDTSKSTYIDHGCILDKQGYPLYPNGNTTFLRLPEDEITNFGMVGYSRTSSSNRRGRNNCWKVTRYFCLGAMTCDNPDCNWAGAPPTDKRKLEELNQKKM